MKGIMLAAVAALVVGVGATRMMRPVSPEVCRLRPVAAPTLLASAGGMAAG